jgi:chromosome transmission fidelity protein 18
LKNSYPIREKEQQDTKKKPKKRRKQEETPGVLWVDKYRPSKFLDLMGDQRLNREVLRWVKQWDFCVFKKEVPKESQRDKHLKQYRQTFHKDPPKKTFNNDFPKVREIGFRR